MASPLSTSGIINDPLMWNAQTRRASSRLTQTGAEQEKPSLCVKCVPIRVILLTSELFLDQRGRGRNHFTTRAQRCSRQEGAKALSPSGPGQEALSPTQVIKPQIANIYTFGGKILITQVIKPLFRRVMLRTASR